MSHSFSYEERLKAMVLREEFFPLMEEVKNAVTVMTKAANGTELYLFNSISLVKQFISDCFISYT